MFNAVRSKGSVLLRWPHILHLVSTLVTWSQSPSKHFRTFQNLFSSFDSENTFTMTYIEKQFGQSRQCSFQEIPSAVCYNSSDNLRETNVQKAAQRSVKSLGYGFSPFHNNI